MDKASLAKTTQLDMQREGLVKIKDALQLTLDTGTTVCSQYDSVEFLAVKDYIEKVSQSYIEEAQSAELSPVCCDDLTWAADESMLESLRNYGEVILQSTENENEADSEEEEEENETYVVEEPRLYGENQELARDERERKEENKVPELPAPYRSARYNPGIAHGGYSSMLNRRSCPGMKREL